MSQMTTIFLGTSSAVPTVGRGLTSIALVRAGELLLFDCGEGTQRAMMNASIGFCRKTKIFITHLHGDHIVGLLGLLQTMSMLNRKEPVNLYGPRGIKGFLEHNTRYLHFGLTFPVFFQQVSGGIVVEENDYVVKACLGKHSTANYAYLVEEYERPGVFHPEIASRLGIPEGRLWSQLQEGKPVSVGGRDIQPGEVLGPGRPGRKFGFSGDTRPTDSLVKFFSGADLLVFDATYDENNAVKAVENGHSTSSEAALVAKRACAKTLVLTHFSARYDDLFPLKAQALKIHSNVFVASDYMAIDVPYPDSGPPTFRSIHKRGQCDTSSIQ